MTATGADWRPLDGTLTAWFDTPSLTAGAALAERILDVSDKILIDVRPAGVRVRLDAAVHAGAVSAAARELGLVADPARLQTLAVVFESVDPVQVKRFWQPVLGYIPAGDDGSADPLHRDPTLTFRRSEVPRPLRNRIHLDVVRPAAIIDPLHLGEASGPFGVCHADPDGNEVDLVPGDALDDRARVTDWQQVFSAMACYTVTAPDQQQKLVRAAAALAAKVGFPLLIDVRPGLVVIDSGKDQWETDTHRLELEFTDLAAQIQTAARDMGAAADADLPRFVQVFFDAHDVDTVRTFWAAALGYVRDPRTGVNDIYDPNRLSPVLAFQDIEITDPARQRQSNRTHLELVMPTDAAGERVKRAVAAGGQPLIDHDADAATHRWRIADPEGNELVIIGG